MTADFMVVTVILLIFACLYLYMLRNRNRRLLRIQRRIEREWGNVPEREYASGEIENISHYFLNKLERGDVEGHYIDDITWNDLDMDSIFCMLNRTYSSVGQEYLYYILRTPQLAEEELLERERLIRHFAENEELRTAFQMRYFEIGRTRRVSVSDYVKLLEEQKTESNLQHYLSVALLAVCVAVCFVNLPIGMIAGITALSVNLRGYYKKRRQIEPYFVTFTHIIRMLKAGEQIGRVKDSEIDMYVQKITEIRKKFAGFQKKANFLSGDNKDSGLADVFLDYLCLIFRIDLIIYNQMLGEVQKKSSEIYELMEILGKIEAVIAIASYRASLPFYTEPEFEAGSRKLHLKNVYHPMIADPVANSITAERGVLITGSNASGKSTFLKTVAINAILAQSIHTCLAHEYRAGYFRVYSSMALKDDLNSQESYYIVEIKSLKRILGAAGQDTPVLCFVDEVLRGTNTVERIAASAQILKSLAGENVLCFAATHDIELTHLLEESYDNYHFQEEIAENDILFNYVLYKGRATSRNAIKLLGIIGYDEKIIKNADRTAEYFLETGEWRL